MTLATVHMGMEKDHDYLVQLITEELAGIISEQEQAYLHRCLAEDAALRSQYEEIRNQFHPADIHNHFARFGTQQSMYTRIRKPFYLAAAVLVLMLTAGWYLGFWNVSHKHSPAQKLFASSKGVTLTTSTGKVLNLSELNQSVEADGLELQPDSGGLQIKPLSERVLQWHTLDVPAGQLYQVMLADGSKVYLNSGSQLRFPTSFANQREVFLTGEAFFEIAPQSGPAFSVKTERGQIQVLGTAFNVNSYGGAFQVSLASGSVKLLSIRQQLILHPGQRGYLTQNNEIRVSPSDASLEYSWRKGIHYFINSDLSEAISYMERWYAVQITRGENLRKTSGHLFSGVIDRNQPLQQFLEDLKASGIIQQYSEKGNKTFYLD